MKSGKEKYIWQLESLIWGFKNVFIGRAIPANSQLILDKMESRLKEVKGLPDNVIINSSAFNLNALDYSFNISYN